MSMERYLCDTCLYANNCQFIAKHKEGAIGCSAYINTFGVSIDRLREICEAERDGRLVLMPCKVGDTVYIRRYSLAQKQNIIIEARVAAVKVFRTGFQIDAVTHGGIVNKCEWGRQCFATRAEAEAALKEQSMNETKKAIGHFHYGITHDIFSEPVTTYARLAVEALREQAERSEGCEYCKTPFKTMLKFDLGIYGNGDTAELYVETDGQNIRAYDNDPRNPQIESSPIRFCPMCGRPLKDGEKHE